MRLLITSALGAGLGFLAACAGVDGRVDCTSVKPGDEACLEGYTCDTATKQCLTTCEDGDACLSSEFCDIDAGATTGVCRYGTPPGGDPAGGD